MNIDRVGRNYQRRTLLVESEEADLASSGIPPWRPRRPFQRHQSLAQERMIAASYERRSLRSSGAPPKKTAASSRNAAFLSMSSADLRRLLTRSLSEPAPLVRFISTRISLSSENVLLLLVAARILPLDYKISYYRT